MKLHSNIFGWEYVWEEFAEQNGGNLLKDEQKILAVAIPAPLPDSHVVFSPMAHGTQVVANCPAPENTEFHLFVQNLMHKFEKVFGAKDIRLNDATFDGRYVIRSNRADVVQALFADASLRQLILQEQVDELALLPPGARVDIHTERPAHHAVLILKRHTFLDKFEQLESALSIVTRLLASLQMHEGSASFESKPAAAPSSRLHSPLLDG